jgi:PAS domain S-box-containing protein
VVGLDGRFERVNPACEACLGWAAEDLLFRPFLDFVHPDDRAATAEEMSRARVGARTVNFETRVRGKDGADRRLCWTATASSPGRAICVTARDVTGETRLERELIEACDRERERMGRELHDGLCQNLAGVAALSATLARKLAARNDPAHAAAAEITALLQQAVGDARDLARGLNPIGLAQLGLAAGLEALAANVEALHGVACAFASDPRFPRLHATVEMHLFRIAQEAVNNAVTHGRGSRIKLRLGIQNGQGMLRVRDNGVGISNGRDAVGGAGLHTMAYRARVVGASLAVRRAPPRGVLVECLFPLSPPPAKEGGHARESA